MNQLIRENLKLNIRKRTISKVFLLLNYKTWFPRLVRHLGSPQSFSPCPAVCPAVNTTAFSKSRTHELLPDSTMKTQLPGGCCVCNKNPTAAEENRIRVCFHSSDPFNTTPFTPKTQLQRTTHPFEKTQTNAQRNHGTKICKPCSEQQRTFPPGTTSGKVNQIFHKRSKELPGRSFDHVWVWECHHGRRADGKAQDSSAPDTLPHPPRVVPTLLTGQQPRVAVGGDRENAPELPCSVSHQVFQDPGSGKTEKTAAWHSSRTRRGPHAQARRHAV